ncbi:signal peptidase II [Tissierella sp. Yu-01]|uniref:signal peptidase II n=1 Tax=Tissierella sp. Yu-01 TaxID=3035694 RepID=UPI00240E888B|nr:signal peptidase II [Tissierella sp. Yu-01]WFA09826.1 signal peptidase II [Tissierella sp. Yu-01]
MIYILLTALIIAFDQVSKFAAIKYLKGQEPYVIIKNYFELRYVENYGAAFGILQQKRIIFVVITTLVLIFILVFLYRNHNTLTVMAKLSISLFIGGAIGNFIDRVRLGYVVDFIRVNIFNIYDFPVFNIADIFIVSGTILIIYIVLFDKYEKIKR